MTYRELDNYDENIIEIDKISIQSIVHEINSKIRVIDVKNYNQFTYYILTSNSLQFETELNNKFNDYRYTIKKLTLEINAVDDEEEGDEENDNRLSKYMSKLPLKRTTIVVKRVALKKLPKLFICNIIIIIILLLVLLFILYTIYKIMI